MSPGVGKDEACLYLILFTQSCPCLIPYSGFHKLVFWSPILFSVFKHQFNSEAYQQAYPITHVNYILNCVGNKLTFGFPSVWLGSLYFLSQMASSQVRKYIFMFGCNREDSQNFLQIQSQTLILTGSSLPRKSLRPQSPRSLPISCMHAVISVVSDSPGLCGLQTTKFLCPQNSPGNNTGVGFWALLQKISQHRDRTHVSYISCIGRQVPYHQHHLESLYSLQTTYLTGATS